MKYKGILPFIAIIIIVFSAVSFSFVYYGILDAKNNAGIPDDTVQKYYRKNIFVSVRNSETNTLDNNMVVSFDPKNKSIKTIFIPSDTGVRITSSYQMLKDVVNIGDTNMLRQVLKEILPISIDYHLIIKSDDLYSENGDYKGLLNYVFSAYLWEVEDLPQYLNQILSLSNTDLTLVKTEEYAEFINNFKEHANHQYTLPGIHSDISGKLLYMINPFKVNEFVNTTIFN